MDASVVILNHNSGAHIAACLRALDGQATDVVVVDNASTDGSTDSVARDFPHVRIVRNSSNIGFAAAANQGVRETSSACVVILNPDAVAEPGAIAALAGSLDTHPRAAVVGAAVRNPDGTVQPTKRAFPSMFQSAMHGIIGVFWRNNPGTRAYTLAGDAFDAARTVDWVAAPVVAVRREAFEDVGGFDEAFFFFVEDVDLCRRLWDAGWEVWFEPGARVVHEWGGSWTQRPLRFMWLHQRNLFRYFVKHSRGVRLLAAPFVAAGLLLRFGFLAIRWLITGRSVPGHRGGAA